MGKPLLYVPAAKVLPWILALTRPILRISWVPFLFWVASFLLSGPLYAQTIEENQLFLKFCRVLQMDLFRGEKQEFRFEGIRMERRVKKIFVSIPSQWGAFLEGRHFSAEVKTGKVAEMSNIENEWRPIPVRVDFSRPAPPARDIIWTRKGASEEQKTVRKPIIDGRKNDEKDEKRDPNEIAEKAEPVPEKTVGRPVKPVIYFEYKNPRYRFSLLYPSEVLIPQPEMENGEGQTFATPDRSVVLAAWGSENKEGKNSQEIFEPLKKDFDTMENGLVKEDSLIITGVKGLKVFHQKTYLAEGFLKSIRFEYPVGLRAVFDPVAEKILKNFSPDP